MPIPLRRFYAQKLINAKNKEAEEIKKSTERMDSKMSQPSFQKS